MYVTYLISQIFSQDVLLSENKLGVKPCLYQMFHYTSLFRF